MVSASSQRVHDFLKARYSSLLLFRLFLLVCLVKTINKNNSLTYEILPRLLGSKDVSNNTPNVFG
jgi:hypothetical protein